MAGLMSVALTLHATSVWPVCVDDVVYECFLRGDTADEAVEHVYAHYTCNSDKTSSRGDACDEGASDMQHAAATPATSTAREACRRRLLRCALGLDTASTRAARSSSSRQSPPSSSHKRGTAGVSDAAAVDTTDADCATPATVAATVAAAAGAVPASVADRHARARAWRARRGVREHVAEQYRLYALLACDEWLGTPYVFLSCHYLPITLADRCAMVQRYYAAAPAVFRRCFGERLRALSSSYHARHASVVCARVWRVLTSWLARSLRRAQRGAAVTATHLATAAAAARLTLTSRPHATISTATMTTMSTAMTTTRPSTTDLTRRCSSATAVHTAPMTRSDDETHHDNDDNNNNNGDNKSTSTTTALRLRLPREAALHRQCRNIERVCRTVYEMYCGKGSCALAPDVPVTRAVAQCYGLQGALVPQYATAVFGHVHNLAGRLWSSLCSYDDYIAVCALCARAWCDASQLFLRDDVVDACRRLARVLDDGRVHAELHRALFGEPLLRPRWHVQLDDMQRVIIPAAMTSSPTSTSTTTTTAVCERGNEDARATTPTTQQRMRRSSSISMGNLYHGRAGRRRHAAAAAAGDNDDHDHASTSSTRHARPQSPSHRTTISGHDDDNNNADAAAATATSEYSVNMRYSRRLLVVFVPLMRQLARVVAQLGVNESISDALDVYYTRIYTFLDTASASHAAWTFATTTLLPPPATSTTTATTAAAAATATMRCAPSDEVNEDDDGVATSATTADAAPSRPPRASRGLSRAASVPLLAVSSTTAMTTLSPSMAATATADTAASAALSEEEADDACVRATTTLHDAHETHVVSTPLHTTTTTATATTTTTGEATAGDATGSAAGTAATATHAASSATSDKTPPHIGRGLLREWCRLLDAVPRVWARLTCVSADDHAELDKTLTSVLAVLRALTQRLLAAHDVA